MLTKRMPAVLALACVLSIAACGDKDSTGPTAQSLAGTYIATQFLATTNGNTTNILQGGGTATLVLNADGTTTGTLFVPGLANSSLSGTWTLTDEDDVDLNSTSDTFFRDMLFSVVGNTLVGDQSFNGTRIQIVLTKQ
jgi:hypothetical protein